METETLRKLWLNQLAMTANVPLALAEVQCAAPGGEKLPLANLPTLKPWSTAATRQYRVPRFWAWVKSTSGAQLVPSTLCESIVVLKPLVVERST